MSEAPASRSTYGSRGVTYKCNSYSWRALEPFRAASDVAKKFLGLMGKGLEGD